MRRILWKGLVALLALIVALSIASCADQAEDANEIIDKANAHIEKFNKLDKELEDISDKIDNVPETSAGAKQALGLINQMKEKFVEQKEEIEAAKKEFEKVKALDVSDELKKYISLELDADNTLIKLPDAGIELATELEKMYKQIVAGTATETSIEAIGKNIDSIAAKVEALDKKSDELEEKAEDYYKEHDLGG